MKKVRITLEMDEHFISMLRATCELKGLGNQREDYKPHTALDCLGVIALLEARGAKEEQIHAETPIEWRNNIQAIHEERKVIEVVE